MLSLQAEADRQAEQTRLAEEKIVDLRLAAAQAAAEQLEAARSAAAEQESRRRAAEQEAQRIVALAEARAAAMVRLLADVPDSFLAFLTIKSDFVS